MKSQITRLEDSTITLKITVPWSEVSKTREEVLEEMANSANLPGFRRGKAPKKIVETVHDRKLESVLSQLISSDDPQEFDMTHDHEKTMGILEGKEYRN